MIFLHCDHCNVTFREDEHETCPQCGNIDEIFEYEPPPDSDYFDDTGAGER